MKPPARLALAVLVSAWAVFACGGPSGRAQPLAEPTVCVKASYEAEDVTFEFFYEPAPGSAMQVAARTFEIILQGAKAQGWGVTGKEYASAQRITYGVVPPGFEQDLPWRGGPPRLERGRRYWILVTAVGMSIAPFTHGETMTSTCRSRQQSAPK